MPRAVVVVKCSSSPSHGVRVLFGPSGQHATTASQNERFVQMRTIGGACYMR